MTSEEVAACCSVDVGSDVTLFDDVAEQASDLLFQLSGRIFTGICTKTVSPRCDRCVCGYQVLSRGHIVTPNNEIFWSLCDACLINCEPSTLLLAGYPVQAISQIKIDGAVLAASEYELRDNRYLIRLNDTRWPQSNDLTLADTEVGTWSVTYTYGQAIPSAGVAAAAELACQLYRACQGDSTCDLPTGITRIVRQNLTIERNAFASWGRQQGIWRTGLPLTDIFLNAYNPSGIKRRPVIMAPGHRAFPVNR